MSTGTDVKLYIDGARFADGSPGEDPSAPVALSGLVVKWGRDTTVDQPDPATCTFAAMDPAGGPAFAGALAVGSRIAVTATATVWAAPTDSTFLDPGFEDPSVPVRAVNASAGPSPDRVHSGASALRVDPVDARRRWTVQLPPAPFAAEGADPGAWDGIAATAPGQTWSAGLWVYPPADSAVEVRPILYTGPWPGAARPAGPAVRVAPGAGWQFASAAFAPALAGAWVGLEVTAYPTGPSWAQTPGPWSTAGGSWSGRAAAFLDDVAVLAPAGGDVRTVLVYAGRITDLQVGWDDARGCPVVEAAAQDFLADLDNRDVGDEPWAVEAMGDRLNRVLDLAGLPIAADIAPSVYGVPVSWRDVDRQGAAGLLRELAESVDGILWAAVHQVTGAYVKVEDPSARPALYALAESAGVVRIAETATYGLPLSSCDVLRDPVLFKRDVASLATRAAVTWKEQTTDSDGDPSTVEHTETLIDAALESRHGTRRVSLSTELTAAGDAVDVAGRMLSRLSVEGWRAEGFVLDDDDLDDAGPLLALLDGTSRIGLPVRVTDLPDWAPTGGGDLGLYLEGGELAYEDGRWIVTAAVSSGHGYGASVAWSELDPTWAWAQFDPAIRWLDLRGVAGPDLEVSTL